MNEALLACGTVGFAVLFYFVGKILDTKEIKTKKHIYNAKGFFFKGLSVVLFLLFMPYMFQEESIANQIGLTGVVQRSATSWSIHLPFSEVATVFLVILKWMTLMAFAVTVLLPFFERKRESRDFSIFITPLIVIFNIIFFRSIAQTIIYNEEGPLLYHWRIIIYACSIALIGAISFERLIRFFVEKDFSNLGKRFGHLGLYILFYLMAFMPIYAPQLFLGWVGDNPADFVVEHRLLIYLTVAFPFVCHFIFRKRCYEERRYLMVMLALSGFIEYFTQYISPDMTVISSLPLHLCNTAIALMFFAYAFNLKGVFYFTYLVNVMGALCALLMPNTSGAFTKMGTIMFFYNHIYAIVLPIMGVSLKIFDRPNLKLMGKAIIAFSCYVFAAAILDGWFNNSASLNPGTYGSYGHHDIDYFFMYSDFFIEKLPAAAPIKNNFVFQWQIGDTNLTIFYLYDLVIFAFSVAFMFVMWGFYGIIYKVEASHMELARRKKLMRVDKTNLLKELNGRSPKEPLHPEGVNMIKINHFSKTYTGSNRKSVDDLNLEIHEGEVFGFIGHNGAGKSTTIKSLVGIQTITEGSMEIEGYDIARQPLEAKLNIGYVSDNHAVYEKLTGREYISYVAELYMVSEKDKEERIKKYASMFGLEEALDREIKSYSHGMKQKLMVISALIHNPKVWVLDEPLTGLDPTSSYQIKECMRQHANEGNIVFFSSHVIEVVEKICDRVAIISGGKLCRVCTPQELTAEGHSLEELYLKYATEGADAVIEDKTVQQDAEEAAATLVSGEENA